MNSDSLACLDIHINACIITKNNWINMCKMLCACHCHRIIYFWNVKKIKSIKCRTCFMHQTTYIDRMCSAEGKICKCSFIPHKTFNWKQLKQGTQHDNYCRTKEAIENESYVRRWIRWKGAKSVFCRWIYSQSCG